MARFSHKAAIYVVLFPLLCNGPVTALRGQIACGGKRDLKRMQKAKGPEMRLLVYAEIAQEGAARIAYCLSPWANTWRESGLLSMPVRIFQCSGVADMLAAVDCAEQGIAKEVAACAPIGTKRVAALRKAQHELAVAESELGYAQVDSEHLALGLGPVVPNEIKARRHALEDFELKITQLLEGQSRNKSGQYHPAIIRSTIRQ